MKHAVVIALIVVCLGAILSPRAAGYCDADPLRHAHDRLALLQPDLCTGRLADQVGKLPNYKAIISYALRVTLGDVLDGDALEYPLEARPPALSFTLLSRHVLLRL